MDLNGPKDTKVSIYKPFECFEITQEVSWRK